MNRETDFDCYADSYDRELGEALSISGEDRQHFANGRVEWLAGCLRQVGGAAPRRVIDYGCGTGSTAPLLQQILGAKTVVGLDSSVRSLDVARRKYGSEQVQFFPVHQYDPVEAADISYCNGVFHHIAPAKRGEVLSFLLRSLRPGGLFSFWENNPWNLGTRYIMSACIFDRDAILLSPFDAKRLLRSKGFIILRTDFLFIFPRILKALRPTEKLLSGLPLGAQFHILCQKPI